VTKYRNHLDRLMTLLGMQNHELAALAGTSRQAIYKLRNGNTRMLPDWAKRVAPHLGVHWLELLDGAPTESDQARADWLAAYEMLDERDRETLLRAAESMSRNSPLPVRPKERPPPHPSQRGAGQKIKVGERAR
jgi:transcriptional regulator with XRE-family HTH domain